MVMENGEWGWVKCGQIDLFSSNVLTRKGSDKMVYFNSTHLLKPFAKESLTAYWRFLGTLCLETLLAKIMMRHHV